MYMFLQNAWTPYLEEKNLIYFNFGVNYDT